MSNTTNERVSALLKTLKIDESEASQRMGKNSSTMYRITAKSSSPTKSTLKLIANALGANYNWLLTGEGEMLAKDASINEKSNVTKALELLEQQLVKKDEQIAQLMAIFSKVNFLKATETANMLMFPNKKQSRLGAVA